MLIERRIYNDLRRELEEPEVLILVGPRQVGKTTLLLQLESDARGTGRRTRFLDLEQPADLARLGTTTADAIDALAKDADAVFVDEFYYLEDAGRVFKAIYDRGQRSGRRVKIVASGSSSVEIHGHLRESLAGRRISYRVYPLTWEEYGRWSDPARPVFSDFLRYGGLPGLARAGSEERKQQLLQEYLATYLLKDIKALVREENIRAFNHLLHLLAQNQGQQIEPASLARDIGVSAPTATGYLEILDQTYVNHLVPSFHTNLANELKKSKKTYLYDLGIRNSILKDFRPAHARDDRGAVFESYVFLTLRALLSPNMELRFWRTKKREEVDFVLVLDRVPYPIEVKSRLDRPALPPGLTAFLRRYPAVRQTFTVSADAHPPRRDGTVTHHFVRFEEVPSILEAIRT